MKLFRMQAGYTLVELVLVIALSAIFMLLALQNIGPRRDFSAFQANVEKLKATIRSAQGQGETGRGDDHNTSEDSAFSAYPNVQNGAVLCGTSLDLTTSPVSNVSSYQYWRMDASQTRSRALTSNNPISDKAGPLEALSPIGGPQTLPAGTTLTFSQGNKTNLPNLHLYFLGSGVSSAVGGILAYDDSNNPIPNPATPTLDCDDLLAKASDPSDPGKAKITIDVISNNNHHATITYDPLTGLLTSTIDR